jgi:hypothetical protein
MLVLVAFVASLAGLVLLVEVNWHFRNNPDKLMSWFGMAIDAHRPQPWIVSLCLLGAGVAGLRAGLKWWEKQVPVEASK